MSPKICCHIMHANGTSLGICAEELDETTIAEAAAVEAEDFERAANLSAKADSAKARLASLDQDLGATDAACSQAVLLLLISASKMHCTVLCNTDLVWKECNGGLLMKGFMLVGL